MIANILMQVQGASLSIYRYLHLAPEKYGHY